MNNIPDFKQMNVQEMCAYITASHTCTRPCTKEEKLQLFNDLVCVFIKYNKPELTEEEKEQLKIDLEKPIKEFCEKHPQRIFLDNALDFLE